MDPLDWAEGRVAVRPGLTLLVFHAGEALEVRLDSVAALHLSSELAEAVAQHLPQEQQVA